MMTSDAWLTITSYRVFHDIPRLVLVADPSSGFWMLDSRFDDELDDYAPDYKTFFAGDDPQQAMQHSKRMRKAKWGK